MSKLGCICGHVISDQTHDLPYKGYILPDGHDVFFEWVVEQTQSYLEAAREGRGAAWLLEQGYGQPYVDLQLSNSAVLYDYITRRFFDLQRTIYECGGCGRVHIETRETNHFASYSPDNGKNNMVLVVDPVT